MADPNQSSISSACRAIADFVKDEIDIGEDTVTVSVGNPLNAEIGSEHNVNLFFYRFDPSGFQTDVLPGETWMVRCFCLITPFAAGEGNISIGENDLRLLGEIMRLFHDNPVQSLDISDGESISTFQFQMIYQTLGLEEISQLWGTQGDIVYRPSLAYEIALMPVIPFEKRLPSPLVGAWGYDSSADMDSQYETPDVAVSSPTVSYVQVNTKIESWAPKICFVHNSQCVETLSFELDSSDVDSFAYSVWVAGDINTEVNFYWEVWDSSTGWRTLKNSDSTTISNSDINPDDISSAILFSVTSSGETNTTNESEQIIEVLAQAGQAVLYAVRSYKRKIEGATGTDYYARSNPLLISIYENTEQSS